MSNRVFIATSLDGFIATKDGDTMWLHEYGDPSSGDDFGFSDFMNTVDALVMGRKTYEQILTFDQWVYDKKVFVLSNTIKEVRSDLVDKVEIVSGEVRSVVSSLSKRGYKNLYIDGGKTIQSFLNEGLIDEMIITTAPILLGDGIKLFDNLKSTFNLTHKETITNSFGLVKSRYAVNDA